MRKLGIILSFIALVVFTDSCTKEKIEELAPLVTQASMSANINNTTWTTITRITKHYTGLHTFVITGTSTSGRVLAITVKGETTGTFTSSTDINDPSAQVGAVWKPSSSLNYVSKSGSITISEINTTDSKLTGTFSFEMVNTSDISDVISIASGKFDNIKFSVSDSTKSALY